MPESAHRFSQRRQNVPRWWLSIDTAQPPKEKSTNASPPRAQCEELQTPPTKGREQKFSHGICRWLAEQSAVYQESRQVEREWTKQKEKDARDRTRGTRWERSRTRGRTRKRGEREKERRMVGLVRAAPSTWGLLRVSRSVVLSVAFQRFRTGCPSSLFHAPAAARSFARRLVAG
ncbi:uncharacterized protein LOC143177345 [Calliopsis andreniformis]|uniref:uncharacterized protein LOC143177345 n=1 Tax=Calliopsis andreniformis TaxID=337506 RepID=UPI003FCD5BC1